MLADEVYFHFFEINSLDTLNHTNPFRLMSCKEYVINLTLLILSVTIQFFVCKSLFGHCLPLPSLIKYVCNPSLCRPL